jgi:hypothetical protein
VGLTRIRRFLVPRCVEDGVQLGRSPFLHPWQNVLVRVQGETVGHRAVGSITKADGIVSPSHALYYPSYTLNGVTWSRVNLCKRFHAADYGTGQRQAQPLSVRAQSGSRVADDAPALVQYTCSFPAMRGPEHAER